jgi:hypothetical protein
MMKVTVDQPGDAFSDSSEVVIWLQFSLFGRIPELATKNDINDFFMSW